MGPRLPWEEGDATNREPRAVVGEVGDDADEAGCRPVPAEKFSGGGR